MNLNDIPVFDSDEENEMLYIPRRPKRFYERRNYFEIYTEEEFYNHFRLRKDICRHLLQQIEDDSKSATDRNNALTPTTKLLLTLRQFRLYSCKSCNYSYSSI
ncbi:hypothetical protein QE152_g35767 [Popillia japonica]|uniref:Uncharacterized protein n=1 Tax=Popillia japonica TaxID=7064 RepID=A0AAW1IEY2_POPJA